MASSPTDDPSDGPNNQETRVDLGEDLLASARESASERVHESHERPAQSADEELQNARILLSEGLMNEAKHSLFRVLRLDPTHRFARDLLEELQKKEVSVLISMSDVREQTALRAKAQEPIEDPEEVLRKLDEDWALGVLESRGPGLSLWTNHEHLKALEQVLLKQVSGSSLRERTDLAVGFLQMEMPSIAVAILAPVKSEQLRAATLYAAALLQNGNAYECLAELEVALRDLELEPDLRREVLYLMARAREVMKQHDEAAVLYAEIVDYRDASFRLARLRPGTGGVR